MSSSSTCECIPKHGIIAVYVLISANESSTRAQPIMHAGMGVVTSKFVNYLMNRHYQ